MSYADFISKKSSVDPATGLISIPELNPMLHAHQHDMVKWALARGRAAIFADCGLGKGPMQMEWATKQPHDALIVAPLAVAHQFVREAEKFGIDLAYAKDQSQITKRITVTNYERLENFHIEQFGAVALDESSILKHSSGAYSTWMIEAFKNTPFRLCSSATPAPNDVMELGTQAEFLGVMTRSEMLAMYFTHDGGDTSKWRVKGHAQAAFWSWMASWAVMIRKPSDLGYSDEGFILPPIHMHEQCVKVNSPTSGFLFAVEAQTLQERQQARRDSIEDRVRACADIVMNSFIPEGGKKWDGSQNTKKTGSKKSQTTLNTLQSTEQSEAERQKKTAHISANTTQQISINGLVKLQNSEPNTTPQDEKNTQATQSCEPNIQNTQSSEIRPKNETEEFEQHTESATSNMTQCLNLKAENAPYAGPINQTTKAADFISTTATIQEKSEDCFAQTATRESENSKTTQLDCVAQHLTLRPWIVWCNLNSEQDALEDLFGDFAISIRGAMDVDEKERGIMAFINQERPILITKPSVAGMGLNFQHCADMAYVGLSDSYEQLYQSIRRCWRFGQTKPVNVHVITAETEGAVVSNIKRKEREAEETYNNMIEHMKDLNSAALHGGTVRNKTEYAPSVPMVIPDFMRIAA